MEGNPFAPPKSSVADVRQGQITQPLWNPNAAANWSLLFSPIFGAFIHMRNWQALDQPERAAASRRWMMVSATLLVGLSAIAILMPSVRQISGLVRPAQIILLLGWYFGSARAQANYVKTRCGGDYPRRNWTHPLVVAILITVGYSTLIMLLAAARHRL